MLINKCPETLIVLFHRMKFWRNIKVGVTKSSSVWWLASLFLAGAVLQKCSSLEFQSPFIPPSEGFLRCENCVKFPRFVADWHKTKIPSIRIHFCMKTHIFLSSFAYRLHVSGGIRFAVLVWLDEKGGFSKRLRQCVGKYMAVKCGYSPQTWYCHVFSLYCVFVWSRIFLKTGRKISVFKQKGMGEDGTQVSFLINKRTNRTSNSVHR